MNLAPIATLVLTLFGNKLCGFIRSRLQLMDHWNATQFAQLVAKGFTKEYGIEYEKTFALISWLTLVRSLLVFVVICHWSLFQIDVKNVFFIGDLLEEVYM